MHLVSCRNPTLRVRRKVSDLSAGIVAFRAFDPTLSHHTWSEVAAAFGLRLSNRS